MVIVMNSQLMLCAVYIYSTEQYRTADGLYQSIHDILYCSYSAIYVCKKNAELHKFSPFAGHKINS